MRFITFNLLQLLVLVSVLCQAPQGFNYQGIARNSDGDAIAGTTIGVQISLLDASATGTVLYTETHNVATSEIGHFSLIIGEGTVSAGTFGDIEWGVSEKYLEIGIDAAGGTSFEVIGTVELLSVPYALYATNSGGDEDADPANELQDLTLTGVELSIENGNTVNLAGLDTDDQPLGEVLTEGADAGGIVISNLGDPIEAQDAVTKSYVDALDQSLGDVLTEGADAGGIVISNLGDPIEAQDAVPKSYVDALIQRIEAMEAQLGAPQPVLWNKLGSITEVENSENGPDGVIVGAVNFDHDVKFGKGITPNTGDAGSGVDFPTTIVNPEKGTVEMWVQFYAAPVAFSHGVYGFANVSHWRPGGSGDPDNIMSFSWHNDQSSIGFVLTFNGTGRGINFNNFNPTLNSPIHVACTWDRNGIVGTDDYMRIYVDGNVVATGTTNNDWGTDNTLGEFRIAAPWDASFATDRYSVDNIKVWDFARTSFSDRDTE